MPYFGETLGNLEDATARLGTRPRRKLHHNTYLERRTEDAIALRLHNTDILTFDAAGYTVDVDGWQTVTTKERLNRFARGARFFSDRGIWYVCIGDSYERSGARYPYADGMHIATDGTVTGAAEDPRALVKLRARVQKYAAAYIAALVAGKVSAPGMGDCLYCQFREANEAKAAHAETVATGRPPVNGYGRTMGELAGKDGRADHILSHIDESYFVPSLLKRALEVMGASVSMWQFLGACGWDSEAPAELRARILERNAGFEAPRLRKALARYVASQIGLAR